MKRILFLLVLCSCQPDQNKLREDLRVEFENKVKKAIEDQAFKENTKLKLYEFRVLTVDTVSQLSVDSQYRYKALERITFYSKMLENSTSLVKINQSQARLYMEMGSKSLAQNALDESGEYLDKASVYRDSMLYYSRIDSLLKKKSELNTKPDLAFVSKAFIKATFFEKQDSSNMLDTAIYFFDKNKNLIDLSTFEQQVNK